MIYIVRHGETAKNKAQVLQGRSNAPLNDAGRLQAAKVRDFFANAGIRFAKVYSSPLTRAVQTGEIIAEKSSPLTRAVQTGEIIAENVPVVTDDRLIEMDYGPYEGMDLNNPLPEVMEFFRDFVHNPAPKGMEQLSDVVARTGEFLEEVRQKAESGNILISTHAIAMKGALEYLTPESKGAYWSKYIGNCAVYGVEVTADGWARPVFVYGG